MRTQASVFLLCVTLLKAAGGAGSDPIPLDSQGGIQLGNGDGSNLSNSLPTSGNTDLAGATLVMGILEKLEQLEHENQGLRQDLERTTSFLTDSLDALMADNVRLREELRSSEAKAAGCGCSRELSSVRSRLENSEKVLMYLLAGQTPPSSEVPSTTPRTTQPYTWTLGYTSSTESDTHLKQTVAPWEFGGREILVNSILVTREGRLVLADRIGRWLLLSTRAQPSNFLDIQRLSSAPWALLELPDGTVAVTLEFSQDIDIYNVSGDELQLVRTVHTGADYGGIALGPEENTLIVSKWELEGVARLDVINMEGEVLRTLLEDSRILRDPYCLRRYANDLYVSDWTSNRFFRVDMSTGEVNTSMGPHDLTDLPIEDPRTFDIDDDGTVYLATSSRLCPDEFCILRIAQNGEVTPVTEFSGQHGGGYPYAVEVSGNEIILSWTRWDYGWTSELTFYSLPNELTMPTPAPLILEEDRSLRGTTPPSDWPLSSYAAYDGSLFTSILITEEGQLLTTDFSKRTVKKISMSNLDKVEDTVDVGVIPWSLAELDNGTVVVTSEDGPEIVFLRLNDSSLELEGRIHTERRYRGAAVCSDGALVVSTRQNDDDWSERDARIDVLSRDGDVMDTLLDGGNFTDLVKPLFLTCRGQDLYISDWASHKVFVLNTDTREVTSAFGNLDLSDLRLFQPRVVAFDEEGNMYVATGGGVCTEDTYFYYRDEEDSFCIIQLSPDGHWNHLQMYISPEDGYYPYGIGITGQQIIISWGHWEYGGWATELAAYDLPASHNHTAYSFAQP